MKTYRFKCLHCNEFTHWKYLRPLVGKQRYTTSNDLQITLRPYSVYKCLKCGLEWWAKNS